MIESDRDAAAREAKAQADFLALLDEVLGPEPPRPAPMRLAQPHPLAPKARKKPWPRTMQAAKNPVVGDWRKRMEVEPVG